MMDYQQMISLSIVALSAVLLVRRQIRKQKRSKFRPCGHDCGCGTPTHASYSEQIKYTFKQDSASPKQPS